MHLLSDVIFRVPFLPFESVTVPSPCAVNVSTNPLMFLRKLKDTMYLPAKAAKAPV